MNQSVNSCQVGMPAKQQGWRSILGATMGTALEWFDLLIYGFFAVTIGKLFFPSDDPYISLLITVTTFGLSYLVRPLGAIVIGHYSDRYGRKKALNLIMLLMGLGTAIIAFAPTYQTAGLFGPVIVLCARLIQGFSAGGEFGAATSYLVAKAGPNNRGFFASFQLGAQGATVVLAGIFGTGLSMLLTTEQILDWGWRIPFFFGLTIVPVAFFIRSHIDEVPVEKAVEGERSPFMETLARYKVQLGLMVGIYVLATSCSYVLVVLMPTYAMNQLGMSQQVAFGGTLIVGTIQLLACPFFGALSDRVGRLPCLLGGAIALLLSVYGIFYGLVAFKSAPMFLAMSALIGILISAYQGPMPAMLSEAFSKKMQGTGIALTHNLATAIFGGFAPMVVTMGIKQTGSIMIPAYYIMAVGSLSLVCLLLCRRRLIKH